MSAALDLSLNESQQLLDNLNKRLMVSTLAQRFADRALAEAKKGAALAETDRNAAWSAIGMSQAFNEAYQALATLAKEL